VYYSIYYQRSKNQTTLNHVLTIPTSQIDYNRTDERFNRSPRSLTVQYFSPHGHINLLSQTKSKGKTFILAEQRHFELSYIAQVSNHLSHI
jgi:hypothetical protein